MLHSKSLLLLCCVCGLAAGQTFFHSSHDGGSYTSITRGAATHPHGGAQPPQGGHPPHGQVYKVAPVRPIQPTYHQPSYQLQTYQQPAYQLPAHPQPTYHQPTQHQPTQYQPTQQQPTQQQPAYPQPQAPAPTYGEKCSLDYVEKYAEVCLPTLDTNCVHEKVLNGVRITEEYDCFPVTRTICTGDEDIELTEVCAVSYSLQDVAAEAKLVAVKWEKECKEEVVCFNPHSSGAYHAAAYCKEQVKTVCVLHPALYPVVKTVVLKLPQPFNTCITKEIILPRVKCQQVTEKKCATVPRTTAADEVEVDKCTVSLGQEQCTDAPLKLPRQACLERFQRTKLVYEEQEQTHYSATF